MRRALRVALVAAVCACAQRDGSGAGEGDSNTSPAASVPSNRTAGVVFDPKAIAVGDTIGTLVVERIVLTAASDSTPLGSVHFRGEVRLVGQVMPHPDPEFESVCFEVDALSASALPRWNDDARRMWFCFSNIKEASQQVMPYLPGQKYEILIDQFVVIRGTSDEVNSARLVKVLGRPS